MDLIKVEDKEIGGNTIQTVNARGLHSSLDIRKDFSSWIKQQIERGYFEENKDFMVITQKGENPNGGRPSVEYHLSLETGKHIAMMSGSRKGKKIRDYFIECERVAKEKPVFVLPDFTNPAESARAWAEQFEKREIAEEKVVLLEDKIEEDRSKVLLAETLLSLEDGDGLIKPNDFAKAIESIYGVGRNTFYQILRDTKIWNKHNIPYARFVQAKYFCIKNNTFYNKYTGQNETSVVVFITPKGRQYLIGKLSSLFDVENI